MAYPEQQPKRISDPAKKAPPKKEVRSSQPWIPAEGQEKKEGFSLLSWMKKFGLPIFSFAILASLAFLIVQVLQSYAG